MPTFSLIVALLSASPQEQINTRPIREPSRAERDLQCQEVIRLYHLAYKNEKFALPRGIEAGIIEGGYSDYETQLIVRRLKAKGAILREFGPSAVDPAEEEVKADYDAYFNVGNELAMFDFRAAQREHLKLVPKSLSHLERRLKKCTYR